MPDYKVTLSMRDAYARETTRSAIINATDPVAADVAVGLWVTDLQASTELQIFKSVIAVESLYAGAPAAGANKDEGMTLSVLLVDGVKKASIQIPGPVQSIRNPDGTIDLTDPIMTDLLVNYTNGNIRISDGEVVGSYIKGTLDV